MRFNGKNCNYLPDNKQTKLANLLQLNKRMLVLSNFFAGREGAMSPGPPLSTQLVFSTFV